MNYFTQPADWPAEAPDYNSPAGWEYEKLLTEEKLLDTVIKECSFDELGEFSKNYLAKARSYKGNTEMVIHYTNLCHKIIAERVARIGA